MTTEDTIGHERVLELLERAVAEKGADYVDPSARSGCLNWLYGPVEDGEPIIGPSCIAGHVYQMLFDAGDERFRPSRVGEGIVPNLNLPFTEVATNVLRGAQYRQDYGKTWGAALTAAREEAARNLP